MPRWADTRLRDMTDQHRYDDIIELEHPVSRRHDRMSMIERAAQFAPFAALTGYDAMVMEEARLTGRKMELDDQQRADLDSTLATLVERITQHPEVSVVYFRADGRKEGGSYVQLTGRVQNIELPLRRIIMKDSTRISLDDIFELKLLDL